MVARTKIVNEQEVRLWFAEGRPYQWMVDEYKRKYGVDTNPSMWGNYRRRHGLDRRKTQNDALLPWRLRDEDRFAYPAIMLRLEARRREGKERDIRPVDLGRLRSWLSRLEGDNVVVAYDAVEGEGFTYVGREPDDDDIIRRPASPSGKRRAVD